MIRASYVQKSNDNFKFFKCLGIKLIKEWKISKMKILRHQKKKLKKTAEDRNTSSAHGLVGLMLWKWPQYPKQPTD